MPTNFYAGLVFLLISASANTQEPASCGIAVHGPGFVFSLDEVCRAFEAQGGVWIGRLDRGGHPSFRVQHSFPQEALINGLSGCVVYAFTITEAGLTQDVRVTSTSNPGFDEYGREAIAQYRYDPLMVNGAPAATPNQTIRLVWQIDGEPLPDHPACKGVPKGRF